MAPREAGRVLKAEISAPSSGEGRGLAVTGVGMTTFQAPRFRGI